MDVASVTRVPSFLTSDSPVYTSQFMLFHCHHRGFPRVTIRSLKDMASPHQVLEEIPVSDTFAWNNLIHTHLSNKDYNGALSIYHHMMLRGGRPDRRTLPPLLTAALFSGKLCFGKQVHGQALKLGFSADGYVITALMELYGRLDGINAAKRVFDKSTRRNSVSWTMLARLYLRERKPTLAIDTFNQMMEFNAQIDAIALVTVIGACSMLKSVQHGRNVHEIARICGLEFDLLVSNSLLRMYIECDSIEDARATFDRMPTKDVISWTEIIRGYVKKGGFNEALKLFRLMNMDGKKPDSLSISSVLPACARPTAHKHGKEIHGYLLRNGFDLNIVIQNALMDMYVKSGFLEYASQVFARMLERDAISWTVMILGYSLHGQGELGIELCHGMEYDQSVEIDEFAYAAVLHSCATACMVEEGKFYFNSIKEPNVTHYALMVSLLARAALFDEAKSFIEEHQIGRRVEVLRALLDGCWIHQQAKIAKQVIEKLCDLAPLNAENNVLLSNWYAHNAKSDIVDELRETIRDMDLKPKKAYSWIEYRNKVHVFGTGDVSHPRSEGIYGQLQCLMRKIEAEQRRPASGFSLNYVDEEHECIDIPHSETLALSFGLINTQAGATIRIAKNLLMCRRCHDFAKLTSKIVEREIIIKDPNCFHHFKDGVCSCRDFW